MKELIMWALVLVAYLIYTFPPVYFSTKTKIQVLRVILSAIIGGTCGLGISGAILSLL
jgi:hypothetical protein